MDRYTPWAYLAIFTVINGPNHKGNWVGKTDVYLMHSLRTQDPVDNSVFNVACIKI